MYRMVAAGDGSPQSPSGYRYYLVAHAIATALLLIALVAAIWQFMDWVGAPSCQAVASTPPVSSAPVLLDSAQAGGPPRLAAPAEVALNRGDCPCPHSGSAKSP
ncbi:hypothetical protein [Mycobacterium sp. 852002-51057_SCH5723018]|uniref:hypothetical protein n=1 Tax=Mycobacterium sp. 852002-51057_SCH5723018 TaxID=1834094 RepID=UPI0012E7E239|nr:hypothetical protein [Mycobacterium sp. 852002-51057_SCH5723018]